MDTAAFSALSAWVTEAGLIGHSESELMAGFCRRLLERRSRLTWSCFARINLMSRGLAETMALAGCRSVFYGIDSGSPAVLARVGETLGTVVNGIEAGVFPHHPTASSTTPWIECPFCDPDGMGVAELRRQFERKQDDPAMATFVKLAHPLLEPVPEDGSDLRPDA